MIIVECRLYCCYTPEGGPRCTEPATLVIMTRNHSARCYSCEAHAACLEEPGDRRERLPEE